MPRNAAKAVRAGHIVDVDELPRLLARLSAETAGVPTARAVEKADTMMEQFERPVALTCPECGGAMRRIGNGPTIGFRCHTGHHFGVERSRGRTTIGARRGPCRRGARAQRTGRAVRRDDGQRPRGRPRSGRRVLGRLKSEADEQLQVLVRFLEHQPPPGKRNRAASQYAQGRVEFPDSRKKFGRNPAYRHKMHDVRALAKREFPDGTGNLRQTVATRWRPVRRKLLSGNRIGDDE